MDVSCATFVDETIHESFLCVSGGCKVKGINVFNSTSMDEDKRNEEHDDDEEDEEEEDAEENEEEEDAEPKARLSDTIDCKVGKVVVTVVFVRKIGNDHAEEEEEEEDEEN